MGFIQFVNSFYSRSGVVTEISTTGQSNTTALSSADNGVY